MIGCKWISECVCELGRPVIDTDAVAEIQEGGRSHVRD
jgi:hypothetical protein